MSRVSGTGSFGNGPNVYDNQQTEFDIETRRSLDGLGPAQPEKFENWSPEQIKEAYEGAVRADRATQDLAANRQTGNGFVASHPEYVDNDANARLLLNQMDTMFGKGRHPSEHFEQAYQYLRENTDFLKLNERVLATQRKEAAKQRFELERARSDNDAWEKQFHELPATRQRELEEMPLEDLRRLADTEHQKQMRADFERRGQEGGW